VEDLHQRRHGRIMIDAVVPDYYARYPKPCVGGWGRRSLNVTPSGRVLPCHAAESTPGLEFWSVREHSLADVWQTSPAFNTFRCTGWIKEPCVSCERRDKDFGGCRCQRFACRRRGGNRSSLPPLPPSCPGQRARGGAERRAVYRHM
jgi:pyrroloquinoline quinone biosynthesis protein E